MSVFVLDFAVQQPRLSSIGRDRDELQKKIAKLQQQRDQCLRADKLSEVCTSSSSFCCSSDFISRIRENYYKGKRKKAKEHIAVNWFPSHSYATSLAIWDHTVLPATRHK